MAIALSKMRQIEESGITKDIQYFLGFTNYLTATQGTCTPSWRYSPPPNCGCGQSSSKNCLTKPPTFPAMCLNLQLEDGSLKQLPKMTLSSCHSRKPHASRMFLIFAGFPLLLKANCQQLIKVPFLVFTYHSYLTYLNTLQKFIRHQAGWVEAQKDFDFIINSYHDAQAAKNALTTPSLPSLSPAKGLALSPNSLATSKILGGLRNVLTTYSLNITSLRSKPALRMASSTTTVASTSPTSYAAAPRASKFEDQKRQYGFLNSHPLAWRLEGDGGGLVWPSGNRSFHMASNMRSDALLSPPLIMITKSLCSSGRALTILAGVTTSISTAHHQQTDSICSPSQHAHNPRRRQAGEVPTGAGKCLRDYPAALSEAKDEYARRDPLQIPTNLTPSPATSAKSGHTPSENMCLSEDQVKGTVA
ncbi:hypothetical protein BDK51DRAFT_41475 [Blyttiomyces helicus]|uniref:Uncharacterized protein n=1 Tax=Blyttiomyces helicus TaxID=388810 RepID=A0A4P9WTN3_9FUNG|nr:hypothetical protein BDK51DRAFT_41475 [Blyttiomyces helicus]|eukprot:RKO94720.1 hypothetical protein BDK51DRAFT_41475 [Blyttiomyces helicus]